MTPRRLFLLVAALLAAAGAAPRRLLAQTDVIRGRIVGPDSAPVPGARVTATTLSGAVSRTQPTDRNGRFTITFPGAEGDYMLSIAAIGYAVKRFEVKRTADQEILVADAKLDRVAVQLDAVKVQGERQKVSRTEAATAPDIGGTEKPVTPAALPPADLGDLAAMAASLPGVQLVPGEGGDNGYSVLGLGADQNSNTLNGLGFGGSTLPRDAAMSSSLVTAPYDVSRGFFSGGQFDVRTRSGSNFQTRGVSLNLAAPQLQWSDRATRALGQEYTNVSLGGALSGPIAMDKAFYNASYQLGRRANDLQTLTNTNALGLQAAGVAADSVNRLLGIMQQTRIPTAMRGIPSDRLSDQGSVLGAFDFAPPTSTTGQAFNLTVSGSWSQQRPASTFGSPTTELPTHGGERTNWSGTVQGRHSGYMKSILSETSLGLNGARGSGAPYLDLPSGAVRVNSQFGDGTSGVQLLSFGGNPNLGSSSTTTSGQARNQLSWFSVDNKHRVKLTSELRYDAYRQAQTTNTLGSFTFNSLADLQAGRAALFTRQLAARERTGGQLVGGIALGDAWRKSNDFQLQYGVRVDANHFLKTPDENPDVAKLFGTSNTNTPNGVFVSPRVGFSWTYGQAAQIGAFEGAFRGPRAVVRGGIGMFQNMPGSSLLGSAIDFTGLPSAVQQLTCVGAATPSPDWFAYETNAGMIPTRCADGTTGTVFANTAPNVVLFDKDYAPQRSVRSNLQWNGPVLNNRFNVTAEATYSLNLNQQSFVDLNFAPNTRFTLKDEGSRPVFVNPTSIVAATGVIASRDARVSQSYSQVRETTSDLKSDSKQLRLSLAPVKFNANFNWNLTYTFSDVRERVRGFTSTVGNPLDVAWARGQFDARHAINYNLGYNLFDFVRINWFGLFRSGNPFTPMIAGDVNGDGYANDRAFVFDQAHASDPAVAAGIQSLLAKGSAQAKACLRKQLGTLAGRNSCTAPWMSQASMSISFNPLKVRMPNRAALSFNLSNPLGAADLLLHGSTNQRGWGQYAFPDQALLYVRGFDPAAQRYKYDVNQRFGATNAALAAFRAPVTLTAMLRYDVGPTRERQMLTQQLDRGRTREGQKASDAMLKAIYGMNAVPNPMATILRQQDSLRLTPKQADSIATMNRWYNIRLDSIWTPVSKYLAELPAGYDRGDAYGRYLAARKATIDLLAKLGPQVKGLLSDAQQRKIPAFVASYLEPRYLASIRTGTNMFTNGGIGILMPGMQPGMVAAEAAARGITVR